MDLSFAKDSKIYSEAVEGLRSEGVPLLEENIKERYEKIANGPKSKEKSSEEAKKAEEDAKKAAEKAAKEAEKAAKKAANAKKK